MIHKIFSMVSYQAEELLVNYLHSRNKAEFSRSSIDPIAAFSTDYIGVASTIHGRYEKYMLKNLLGFLDSISVGRRLVIDVGANVGNHSLYFSRHFDKVIAFEPNPINFELLVINSRPSNSIECYNYGLSENDEKLHFRWHPCNMAGGHIATYSQSPKALESAMNIQGVDINDTLLPLFRFDTLPTFKDLYSLIDLIKLDVERHELSVLKGMANFLHFHNPVIVFEQHISEINRGTTEVIQLLQHYGYSNFYEISEFPIGFRWKRITNLKSKRYNMIAATKESPSI